MKQRCVHWSLVLLGIAAGALFGCWLVRRLMRQCPRCCCRAVDEPVAPAPETDRVAGAPPLGEIEIPRPSEASDDLTRIAGIGPK